jgi:hypothetical protein
VPKKPKAAEEKLALQASIYSREEVGHESI